MKRFLAGMLCCMMILALAACGKTEPPAETTPTTAAPVITDEIRSELDEIIANYKWQGIVSLTYNGEIIYQSASGTNGLGEPLTVDSPMYIGSVSKQFCAAATLILRDEGKLSVEDTLDKYFPEYAHGKDITIKHLLTMRSGIPNFTNYFNQIPVGSTGGGIMADLNAWAFSKELNFAPDAGYEYSNTNYALLGQIVEQVSGQDYEVFIRQRIFEPLGMDQSGFVMEVQDQPAWAEGLNYDHFQLEAADPEMVKGAGDITSTAADIHKWMAALPAGKVISPESYREMITNYSQDLDMNYGYALAGMAGGGYGHTGNIGTYVALDYFNETTGYALFLASSRQHSQMQIMAGVLVNALPH